MTTGAKDATLPEAFRRAFDAVELLDDQQRANVLEAVSILLRPPEPSTASMRAAEEIVSCMHLYDGYKVGDSRGPNGCLLRALEAVAPHIASVVREEGWDAAHARFFPTDEESDS